MVGDLDNNAESLMLKETVFGGDMSCTYRSDDIVGMRCDLHPLGALRSLVCASWPRIDVR